MATTRNSRSQVDLKVVEEYLRRKVYPEEISKDIGKKANFQKNLGRTVKIITRPYRNAKNFTLIETKTKNAIPTAIF